MDITEQLQAKAAYINANCAKPSGTLTIRKNGPYDVKDYAFVNAVVDGGAWDGTNDVTIRFYEQGWGEDEYGDSTIVKWENENFTGYYTINGGSPIYFSFDHELFINNAVNIGDGSYFEIYFANIYGGGSANLSASNCEYIFEQVGDAEYYTKLYNFTGNATLEVVRTDW